MTVRILAFLLVSSAARAQTSGAPPSATPATFPGRKLAATGPAISWAVLAGSQCKAAAAQADGSTLITGRFSGTASFGAPCRCSLTSSNRLTADGFVAKLDSAGAFLWAVGFGGSSGDYSYGIAAHADGTATVVGRLGTSASLGGTAVAAGGFASAVQFPCAAGSHSTAPGGVDPCAACPIGQYQDTIGNDACTTPAPTGADASPVPLCAIVGAVVAVAAIAAVVLRRSKMSKCTAVSGQSATDSTEMADVYPNAIKNSGRSASTSDEQSDVI